MFSEKGTHILRKFFKGTFSEATPSAKTLLLLILTLSGNGVRLLMADAVMSAREISVCGVCCALARAGCCRWLTRITLPHKSHNKEHHIDRITLAAWYGALIIKISSYLDFSKSGIIQIWISADPNLFRYQELVSLLYYFAAVLVDALFRHYSADTGCRIDVAVSSYDRSRVAY